MYVVNMKKPYQKGVPENPEKGTSWISNWYSHRCGRIPSEDEVHYCCNSLCVDNASSLKLSELNGAHVQESDDIIVAPFGKAYIIALCSKCNGKGVNKDYYNLDDVIDVDKEDLILVGDCISVNRVADLENCFQDE